MPTPTALPAVDREIARMTGRLEAAYARVRTTPDCGERQRARAVMMDQVRRSLALPNDLPRAELVAMLTSDAREIERIMDPPGPPRQIP